MFYEDRPKIKLKKTTGDNIVEYTSLGLLVFSIIYTLYFYKSLPEQIPMHFNTSGEVNGFGSKDSIWALHAIGIATAIGLYFLNKSPHIFNYPQKITIDNAKKYYTDATRILRYTNLGIVIIFTLLEYQIINIALKKSSSLNGITQYIVLAIIATITLFPIVYVFKNLKKKK